MGIHYTKQGKLFTQIISKEPVPAVIQTLTHRIEGNIHVRHGDRLMDELANGGQFLAVTEAAIYNISGKKFHAADFLALNRDHIVWLLPTEQASEYQDDSGGQA